MRDDATIGPETVTPEVIDFLSEDNTSHVNERVRRHRERQRLTKTFTACKQCGKRLVKYGVYWGTNDEKKAICADCKKTHTGCTHDRLRSFTFADGNNIKMCPDCTRFDGKRYEVLNKGKKKSVSHATKRPQTRLKKDHPSAPCYQGMAHLVMRPAPQGISALPLIGPVMKHGFFRDIGYVMQKTSEWVVVPMPVIDVKSWKSMPEWMVDRDERDWERLSCLYDFPKPLERLTPQHWNCMCLDCKGKYPNGVSYLPCSVTVYEHINHLMMMLKQMLRPRYEYECKKGDQ